MEHFKEMFTFMCMGLLPAYMMLMQHNVYTAHMSQKQVIDLPGTGVTNGCELKCGCWELDPGLLGEQLNS